MVLSFKASRKDWSVRLVSKHLWAEAAVWTTKLSGLPWRWAFKRRGNGFLIVTPLISMGVTVDVG